MNKDEARRLLTEAAIEMVPRFKRMVALEDELCEEFQTYVQNEKDLRATPGLYNFVRDGGLTPDEQWDTFVTACNTVGLDPHDPDLDIFRAQLERLKLTPQDRVALERLNSGGPVI